MKKIKKVLLFLAGLDKVFFPVILLAAAVETFESFGVLLISSAVLNCLAAGAGAERILRLILVMTLGYGLLRLLRVVLIRYRGYLTRRFSYRYGKFVTEQIFRAPYCRLEEEEFVETVDQVRQNDQTYDLTMSIMDQVFGIIQTAFSVIIALSSFVRLFGTLQHMEKASFPVALLLLLLFLLIVSSTGYIVWRRKSNTESMIRLTEELVKRDKVAMYLLNEVIARYTVGKHIRLYGMQERLLQEEQKYNNGIAEMLSHTYRMEIKPDIAGDVSSVAISGVVYLIVSLAAMWGGLGAGSIIWYAGIVQRLLEAVRQMIQQVSGLYYDCRRQEVVFRLQEMASGEPGESAPASGGESKIPAISGGNHTLEFEDVSFAYPKSERMILEHVNLQLSGRQRVALVGKNGSGKSTLIKLICRLYEPSAGRILLDGTDIRQIPQKEYMEFLSVVFQDYQIFAATLGENIALGQKTEEAGIRKVIEQVGLGIADPDTPLRRDLEENGVEVSGGEGQKIAIARALYKDAPLVILDEPTASLDPISESEIYEKFNELVEGKLSLFISHRLSSCRFCDRILVLQDGAIVQDGSHESLSAQRGGLYREMWEAQRQYYV